LLENFPGTGIKLPDPGVIENKRTLNNGPDYKSSPMKHFALTTILPLILLSTAFAFNNNNEENNNKNKDTSHASIKWLTFEEAVRKSNQHKMANRKKVFIDIYTDWCGWCKKMDRNTFQDSAVIEYIEKYYYPVKLDAEMKRNIVLNGDTLKYISRGKRGTHELALKLINGNPSYPTTVFLDERFNMLTPVPGYQSAANMKPILRFFGKDHHKTDQDINEYIKKHRGKNQNDKDEGKTDKKKNKKKKEN
jgi:thioredoxin-related protein